jgi:hypothetical protein
VEQAFGAQVGRVSVTLDNLLRHQTQALLERQRLCAAFRQHPGYGLRLSKVSSHGSDAVRVQGIPFGPFHTAFLHAEIIIHNSPFN